jgi:RNA polymerase sigma-70 factor (sigma-E family)
MDTQAEEYERFVRARTPALLRSAYLLTGDQHLAEDLVQEALARTHRAWRRLFATGNAEAYARKIMYHQQVSLWRRRRVAEVFPGTLPDLAGRGAHDHAGPTALRLAVERALVALSPRQRAVIVLRYFEDRTEAESAEILGVAIGTVKVLATRALQRLRASAPELSELMATEGTDR